jgi:hypothetical protein
MRKNDCDVEKGEWREREGVRREKKREKVCLCLREKGRKILQDGSILEALCPSLEGDDVVYLVLVISHVKHLKPSLRHQLLTDGQLEENSDQRGEW